MLKEQRKYNSLSYLLIIITFFLANVSPILCLGQNGNISSGNSIKASSGEMSFSIGQVFYNNQEGSIEVNEGLHQPFEIFILSNELSKIINTEISLYPNPTEGNIVIGFEQNPSIEINYTIVRVNGQILQSGSVDGKSTLIDLNSFAKGVYLIILQAKNKNQQIYRVIKK